MDINGRMQTQVRANFPGSNALMNQFSNSEYLETKYFSVTEFLLNRQEKLVFSDVSGKGILWRFFGVNTIHSAEKILTIKEYDRFPSAVYISTEYINHSKKSLTIKKWVNSANDLMPSGDSIKFRIFQGSSHSDRRDWIHSLKAGFNEQKFMGMNATDYGGGIPVVDFWRKDDGLAIGLLEPEAKLISLPVDYDRDAFTAKISIEYIFPEAKMMFPGDTIHSFETFVSVHQKDCFSTLQIYGSFMQTKGVVHAHTEPSAYDPIWCVWRYKRNFNLN